MSNSRGDKWSMDRVGSLSGKVAVITGANSGIGYETALGLAKKDMTVILGCRDLTKAQKAKSAILYHYPGAQIDCLPIDTSSLRSVSAFATLLDTQYGTLDLLINNAGIMMSPYQVTEEGFENQFATNYLGHFALTGLLLPLLKSVPGSRVITLSSLSYKWAELDFDDLQAKKGYSRRTAYGQSKRACLIFAYELQRRLAGSGYEVRSVAAHPGLAKTNLDQYFPALIRPLGSLFLQPPAKEPFLFCMLLLEQPSKAVNLLVLTAFNN